MSRVSSGNVQYIKAGNNVYTVLVAVALLVEIVGFVVLYKTADSLFPATPGGRGQPAQTGGLFG